MDLEEYLSCDPEMRILNKSLIANLTTLRNHSEIQNIKKRGNWLLRQEINDYTPECTPKFIFFFHLIFGIICLGFGIPITIKKKDSYYEIQYDNCAMIEAVNNDSGKIEKKCTISLSIEKTLESPIFVYYKLENFFSNHREFVKSKLYPQLRGESVSDTSNCDNMKTYKDLFGEDDENMRSFTGQPLNPKDLMDPCGLIARSFFNDTFALLKGNELIKINETGIVYSADQKYMFKRNENPNNQWIDVENEHFMVWMNMELFSTFLKKWGHIDKDLEAGTYDIEIENNWVNNDWDTKKYFVLVSPGKFGNKTFIGYALIIGATFSIITIILIILCGWGKLKKFEPEKLNWDE